MNLRFWQRETPHELLAGKYANVGELGIAWDDYDLLPELLNQPLGAPYAGPGVDVAYESENPRSEAHLYARNPRAEYRCQDIPKGVYLAAKKEQTQYVLKESWQSVCLTKQKNPCTSAAEIAQDGVELGADTLEALGFESFSGDDVDTMKEAISERTDPKDPSSPLKHWTCIPTNSDEGQCAFALRAKRLNVYPDAVELVWFDGKEVRNPTYALYVAAHMKTGTDPSNGFPTFDESKVDKLCSYHPGILGETREFTLSNQGLGDEWEFIPSICKNGFDWHVDCSFHGPPPRRAAWAIPLVGLALAAARRWGRKTTGRS